MSADTAKGRETAQQMMDAAEARYRHEHGLPHRRGECEGCARETDGTHVDMIARLLVGSDWDDEIPYTDHGSRETVAGLAGRISTAMAIAYYRQAADSLDAIADHADATGRGAAYAPGIRYAADRLRRSARDMEEEGLQ